MMSGDNQDPADKPIVRQPPGNRQMRNMDLSQKREQDYTEEERQELNYRFQEFYLALKRADDRKQKTPEPKKKVEKWDPTKLYGQK